MKQAIVNEAFYTYRRRHFPWAYFFNAQLRPELQFWPKWVTSPFQKLVSCYKVANEIQQLSTGKVLTMSSSNANYGLKVQRPKRFKWCKKSKHVRKTKLLGLHTKTQLSIYFFFEKKKPRKKILRSSEMASLGFFKPF